MAEITRHEITAAAHRRSLPNRRFADTFSFAHDSGGGATLKYVATVGRFSDGAVAEIFVNAGGKLGSAADVSISDAAVAVSLALQYGCPAEVIRAALKRDNAGRAQGPIGAVLDLVGASK